MDTAALDLFSSRGEGGGGKRRCWELGAGEGSLLSKAPGRPFLIFSPFPRVTSNHIFLLHTLLTRSGSETSHRPLTHTDISAQGPQSWQGSWLGERGDLGTEEKVDARCAGRGASQPLRAQGTRRWWSPGCKPGSLWFLLTSGSQTPFPFLKQGVLLAACTRGPLSLML